MEEENLKFVKFDDKKLREAIIESYGYFNKGQFEFSKRLLIKMEERRWTSAYLAEKTRISTGAISNYVTGKRVPRTYELDTIARALQVSSDYLIGLTDCLTYSAEEVNRMIGLSEKSMRNLFMLQHNVTEFEEITDNVPVSNELKGKLDALNYFLEDNKSLLDFLTSFELYSRNAQKLREEMKKNTDEIDSKYIEDKKLLLLGYEGKMIKLLMEILEKIGDMKK